MKRKLSIATDNIGHESDGPGSASPEGHMAYGGSRQWGSRWEYKDISGAGFAELHPKLTPTAEQFFEMRGKVSGVTHVKWNTSKASQGNRSEGHYMEQNILVSSRWGQDSDIHPFEFELTRNRHMKGK